MGWGAWLAHLVEHETLDLRVMSSNLTLGRDHLKNPQMVRWVYARPPFKNTPMTVNYKTEKNRKDRAMFE